MADGLKMAVVVLGLLAMVHQTMQLRITFPLPDLPEDGSANRPPLRKPSFAVLLASATNELALNESGLFVSYYYTDIAGRRFHLGTLGGVSVVYALTGAMSSDAAVTTQIVLNFFPGVRAIVHVGSALTLDTSILPVGSVSVVKSVAYTGYWRWKTLSMPRDEVEASKRQLRFGDYTYPNKGFNSLGAVQFDPTPVYTPEYTETLKSKFWYDIDAQLLEIAARGLKDVELKKCYNSTHCLSTDPEIKYGLKASTSDIYIQNGAYANFLLSKFNAATADQESSEVVRTAKANGVLAVVFRAASSSLISYDYPFSKVASYNAVLAATKFVGLFPQPRDY